MLNVLMLGAIMLNVVMLSVIMLSVMAPSLLRHANYLLNDETVFYPKKTFSHFLPKNFFFEKLFFPKTFFFHF